jgi:hypothetical protein
MELMMVILFTLPVVQFIKAATFPIVEREDRQRLMA